MYKKKKIFFFKGVKVSFNRGYRDNHNLNRVIKSYLFFYKIYKSDIIKINIAFYAQRHRILNKKLNYNYLTDLNSGYPCTVILKKN